MFSTYRRDKSWIEHKCLNPKAREIVITGVLPEHIYFSDQHDFLLQTWGTPGEQEVCGTTLDHPLAHSEQAPFFNEHRCIFCGLFPEQMQAQHAESSNYIQFLTVL
jgi:hypothetical protein